MLRFKTEELYNKLGTKYDPTSLTLNELVDFCAENHLSYCVLRYSDDGLYLISDGSILRLNAESEIIDGTGVFKKYLDDDEDLYEELRKHLNKIDEKEYDIVYENSSCIDIDCWGLNDKISL